MQRCVEYNFLSRSYRLMYNGAAMFALNEKFPGLEGVFETIMESTPSGTDALYDVWLILASNGEAVKKWLGYESVPLPEKDELAAMSTVDDLARMRDAVAAAIMAGLGREYESKAKVIDLGLEELEKERKKKTGVTLYEYLRAAAICGFDARTALMMPPGTVFDTLDEMAERNEEKEADD